MKIEKEFTLKSLVSGYSTIARPGKPYYEQVLMYEGDYPFAMVHVDMFWPGRKEGTPQEKYAIHDALSKGKRVKVKVTFELIDEDN